MRFRRNGICAAVMMAVAALLALGPPARADFVLLLSTSASDFAWYDATNNTTGSGGSGSGITFTELTGAINAVGSIGGMTLATNLATATAKPGTSDQLDLAYTAQGSGTVTMTAYNTGLSSVPGGNATLIGSIGGTLPTNSSVTANSWFDATGVGNASSLPAFSAPAGSVNAFGAGGYTATNPPLLSDSKDGFASVTVGNTSYALMSQVVITSASANNGPVTGDLATTVSTPEPASLALWISGLPVLGLVRYWRRRRPRGPLAIS